MYKKVVFVLLMGLMVVGCGDESNKDNEESTIIDTTNAKPFAAPAISEADKTKYLDVINNARSHSQDCGEYGTFSPAPPLTWDDDLYAAAAEHNYDMAKSNMLVTNHRGSGTQYDWTKEKQGLTHASYFNERIQNNKYTGGYPRLENLTLGCKSREECTDTAEKAVISWLESPGHCKNLMNKDVKEVGMAYLYEENSTYEHYWTQDFGGN